MILLSDIMRAIADAVEASADIKAIADRFPNGYRLVVGRLADGALEPDKDRITIGIGFSDTPYELGYAQQREAAFTVRVAVWDKETDADGIRDEATGALVCSDLCHRIAEAVKGITGIGDDLTAAQVSIDASGWPMTVGTTALTVTWPVGLNQEATL